MHSSSRKDKWSRLKTTARTLAAPLEFAEQVRRFSLALLTSRAAAAGSLKAKSLSLDRIRLKAAASGS